MSDPLCWLRRRRRRRRLSLLVIIEGDREEEVVFTRENQVGIRSTRNTRNTDPFKPRTDESLALFHPYTACTVSATVAFIHITLPAPSRMGRTSRSVQIRRDHSSLRLGKSVCLLCDCGSCLNYILRG